MVTWQGGGWIEDGHVSLFRGSNMWGVKGTFRRNFLLLSFFWEEAWKGYTRGIFFVVFFVTVVSPIKRTETFGHVPLACNKRCEILPG